MVFNRIADIAWEGILTIPQTSLDIQQSDKLVESLLHVNRSASYRAAAEKAEETFRDLTSAQDLSADQINGFLHGWRTAHLTALYVSGLMIRVQNEASETSDRKKAALLSEAAYHIGQIIVEDTGVIGGNHTALFDRFATGVAGNDMWRLDCNAVSECTAFRVYVERQRTKASIEDGILTTAASENWNTGEYTHAAEIIPAWLQTRGKTEKEARIISAYVTVHAGKTELGHFTHALKAWQLYCKAHDREADPYKCSQAFQDYAAHAEAAFEGLTRRLAIPAPPPRRRLSSVGANATPVAVPEPA